MSLVRFLSIAEQVAAHLRGELARGRWSGLMPGKHQVAEELGINNKTVESALRLLESEGLLVSQGAGRRRRIGVQVDRVPLQMRIAILDYEPLIHTEGYLVELQHLLMEAGHVAFFAEKSLSDLRMEVPRIRRFVKMTKADAWVVLAGSREVLGLFASQAEPAFALFGRRRGLPIAGTGPDKPPAMAAATRALVQLGHRRIVLLARPARRLPEPGASERAFLDELAAHGVSLGNYHLPDWEESIAGFHQRLESLFRVTPPTALIIDEAPFFVAALQFCSGRGLRVPQDVSLVCTDADPTFAWCKPTVAHIRWDSRPAVKRVLRWAAHVSHGEIDTRQTLTRAEFVAGGTIGPVPR